MILIFKEKWIKKERDFWSVWRERKKKKLRLERKAFKQTRDVMYLLG